MTTIRVTVLLLFRDAELYLRNFLIGMLDKQEIANPEFEFRYVIYENDSIDKTKEVLTQFSESPKVKERTLFISETLGTKRIPELDDYKSTETVTRLANARNRLLEIAKETIKGSDWVLCIDDNIYFDEETFKSMYKLAKGSRKTIAITTCNTMRLFENDGGELAKTAKCPDDKPFFSLNHYYDTKSHITINGDLIHPACPNEECEHIICKEPAASKFKWMKFYDRTRVRTAWGGFVIIDSTVFNDPEVKWQQISVTDGEKSLSEHIYFCDHVNMSTKKDVLVCLQIRPMWIPSK